MSTVVRILAALWCGSLWSVGLLVAPTLFNTVSPTDAGRVVAVVFLYQAIGGMVAAAVMLLLDRSAAGTLLGTAGRKATLLMAVGVGLGYFALKPLMDHGRALLAAGQPIPAWADFGMLHGVSSAIYLLVALLGLRLVAVVR